MDRPQGAGITKELAPTTGSGSFLPQAASDWPGEEAEGPGEGVQTVQAFVLGQVWPVGMQPRGRRQAVGGGPLCFGKRQNPDT